MKLEEALALMRTGKKIRHPSFEPDVYFQACRVGLMFDETPLNESPISIVKMMGDIQHEDMCGVDIIKIDDMLYSGTLIIKEKYVEYFLEKPCKHGNIPQLNLFLLMSDEWEII